MKTRETKQKDLNALTESLQSSKSAMVVSFTKLSVNKDQEFRNSIRAAGGKYQVVKVCSLLTLAEFKKLAPWPPYMEPFAKVEEEPIGPDGSSCNYPTAHVQVMSFRQSMIDSAKKGGGLEPVSGVGEEAYVHNNQDRFAELFARVGAHLLTVQFDIVDGKTFASTKPQLMEVSKALAARLR